MLQHQVLAGQKIHFCGLINVATAMRLLTIKADRMAPLGKRARLDTPTVQIAYTGRIPKKQQPQPR